MLLSGKVYSLVLPYQVLGTNHVVPFIFPLSCKCWCGIVCHHTEMPAPEEYHLSRFFTPSPRFDLCLDSFFFPQPAFIFVTPTTSLLEPSTR